MSQQKLTAQYLYVDFLMQPLPIISVLVTFMNDHWLKYEFPGILSGKLSDICGLFYFPLFLCALILIFRKYILRRPALEYLSKSWLIASLVLTGIIFSLIKIYAPASVLYLWSLSLLGINGRVTPDYTDLFALLILALTYWQAHFFFKLSTTET